MDIDIIKKHLKKNSGILPVGCTLHRRINLIGEHTDYNGGFFSRELLTKAWWP
jgi:hypothetical protein